MKLLMLDIETAPHVVFAWGLYDQTIATDHIVTPGYTLCWAAKWYGTREVLFSSVQKHGADKMLSAIHGLLNEADAVAHYNGSRFDIPTLNGEFLARGMKPPAPYHEIDLLKTARERFRLASNKLNYVAQTLNVGEKVKHKGMDLWRGCMNGNRESWQTMEKYNKGDVILLERVYNELLPWIKNHPNRAMYRPDHGLACNNCGSRSLERRGVARTKAHAYQRFQCRDCGTWLRSAKAETPQSPTLRAA